MNPGDIVVYSLPQADNRIKKRPVLLLKKLPGYNDWLVCGISSQLHQYISGFDEKIDPQHPDFKSSGLFQSSVIRLSFLFTIPSHSFPGKIGYLSKTTTQKMIHNLIEFLKNS